MINQPLTSNEQSKIMIFGLLMLPIIVIPVGVIPAIFLIFGIFMMKKNNDFSHVETAVKNSRIYIYLALTILAITAVVVGISNGMPIDVIYGVITAEFVAIAYLLLMNTLFYKPLADHKNWVAVNEIFSIKSNLTKKSAFGMDIIKREKMGAYSVADELIKWAKLR